MARLGSLATATATIPTKTRREISKVFRVVATSVSLSGYRDRIHFYSLSDLQGPLPELLWIPSSLVAHESKSRARGPKPSGLSNLGFLILRQHSTRFHCLKAQGTMEGNINLQLSPRSTSCVIG